MKNIDVHEPEGWRAGEDNRELMRQYAERAKTIYRIIVKKRTGALAASAQASVQYSNKYDGYYGVLSTGAGIDYEAAHELRANKAYGGEKPKDLNRVLNMLAEGY